MDISKRNHSHESDEKNCKKCHHHHGYGRWKTVKGTNSLLRPFRYGAGVVSRNGSALICGGQYSTDPYRNCDLVDTHTLKVRPVHSVTDGRGENPLY